MGRLHGELGAGCSRRLVRPLLTTRGIGSRSLPRPRLITARLMATHLDSTRLGGVFGVPFDAPASVFEGRPFALVGIAVCGWVFAGAGALIGFAWMRAVTYDLCLSRPVL